MSGFCYGGPWCLVFERHYALVTEQTPHCKPVLATAVTGRNDAVRTEIQVVGVITRVRSRRPVVAANAASVERAGEIVASKQKVRCSTRASIIIESTRVLGIATF